MRGSSLMQALARVKRTFRDRSIQTTGTAATKILPPVSRFAAGTNHREIKQYVLLQLTDCFNRFIGLGQSVK